MIGELSRIQILGCVMLLLMSMHRNAEAQSTGYSDPFPTSRWCQDSGTACWADPSERDWFNGVRVIADFDIRFLFQTGRGRFLQADFLSLPKLAIEVNIYKSWVAAQIALRGPGNVQIDSLSPARHAIRNRDGIIPNDIGLSAGLSFLDSSVALMWGWVFYDARYFNLPNCTPDQIPAERLRRETINGVRAQCILLGDRRDSHLYLTLQPISAIRSGIKQGEQTNDPDTQ